MLCVQGDSAFIKILPSKFQIDAHANGFRCAIEGLAQINKVGRSIMRLTWFRTWLKIARVRCPEEV